MRAAWVLEFINSRDIQLGRQVGPELHHNHVDATTDMLLEANQSGLADSLFVEDSQATEVPLPASPQQYGIAHLLVPDASETVTGDTDLYNGAAAGTIADPHVPRLAGPNASPRRSRAPFQRNTSLETRLKAMESLVASLTAASILQKKSSRL